MTTENITIIHKDREVLLEVNATAGYQGSYWQPPEDPEVEIIDAKYKDGEILSDDEVEFLYENEEDQIWDKLIELDQGSQEDYQLEKHEDNARERRRDGR